MKLRNGFVSNSSSSSFVVALRSDVTGANEFFDFFRKLAGGYASFAEEVTVAERLVTVEAKKKELAKDIRFTDARMAQLIDIASDQKICKVVDLVWTLLQDKNLSGGLRVNLEYNEGVVQQAFRECTRRFEWLKKQMKSLEEEIAKYKALPPDSKVLSWREDATYGILKTAVEALEKDGKLVIIDRHST